MSTIIQRLEDSGYKPTEAQLREFLKLARSTTRVSGAVEGGYFKVLLTRSIDLSSVKMAHDELYPIVKEECITEDMTAQERNKATNFARSAYGVLLKAEKNGATFTTSTTKGELIEYNQGKTTKEPMTKMWAAIAQLNTLIHNGEMTRDEVLKYISTYI